SAAALGVAPFPRFQRDPRRHAKTRSAGPTPRNRTSKTGRNPDDRRVQHLPHSQSKSRHSRSRINFSRHHSYKNQFLILSSFMKSSSAVNCDFLVIGSGLAGLLTALKLAPHGRVVLLTTGRLE